MADLAAIAAAAYLVWLPGLAQPAFALPMESIEVCEAARQKLIAENMTFQDRGAPRTKAALTCVPGQTSEQK